MQAPDYAYAVILAGGGGTRLWPKSRKKHPKHLLKLFGDRTLIQLTFDRVAPILPPERILVITNEAHIDQVKEQLPDLPSENIIAEPVAKNTAIAMGVAAAFVHKRNPGASLIYLAADHLYKNIEKFQQTAITGLEVSRQGDFIVAIGIRPTFPHTGLGYIKIGEQLEEIKIDQKNMFAFKGKGFKEKPDLVTAQSFLASGQYLWNANLYCWSTKTIFNSLEVLAPHISEAVKKVVESDNPNLEEIYSSVEKADSIDYEVSEKAKNIVVVPGDFGWSDIGDWKIVYETEKKDDNANVIINNDAHHIEINSRNNLIDSNGKMIVTVGVENLVIIETDDAILICDKNKSQDVKKVVEKLKEQEKNEYL